jgi:hypothetical protein
MTPTTRPAAAGNGTLAWRPPTASPSSVRCSSCGARVRQVGSQATLAHCPDCGAVVSLGTPTDTAIDPWLTHGSHARVTCGHRRKPFSKTDAIVLLIGVLCLAPVLTYLIMVL